ncbi:hypothetical protein ACIQYF_09685 [Pseudomonas sp. NPDC096917]|uniref:hypothetical protein n=1 Tax=Pseudomonas sp. NPDC096917 TaxID=3364483 RepID=UPI003839D610
MEKSGISLRPSLAQAGGLAISAHLKTQTTSPPQNNHPSDLRKNSLLFQKQSKKNQRSIINNSLFNNPLSINKLKNKKPFIAKYLLHKKGKNPTTKKNTTNNLQETTQLTLSNQKTI